MIPYQSSPPILSADPMTLFPERNTPVVPCIKTLPFPFLLKSLLFCPEYLLIGQKLLLMIG